MSERSVYLRDQAANQLTDAETQEQLPKLAAEYTERAAKIERKDEAGAGNRAELNAGDLWIKNKSTKNKTLAPAPLERTSKRLAWN
jgi:hypothetical protein